MKYVTGLLTGLVLAGLAWGTWWIATMPRAKAEIKKAKKPANVDHLLKEEDVNRIVLTPAAKERLGIGTATVTKRKLLRTRIYAGEAVIPAGRTILVTAPLGGVLKAPKNGMPAAGSTVRVDQAVLHLLPLLTPEGRATIAGQLVDADGQVKTAKASRDATKIALTRAERVLREAGGSRRAVDDAQAAYEVAVKTLDAASARRDLLSKVASGFESGTADPIEMKAPAAGMLRTVSALPGQTVPGGAALFEVVDLSSIWVRVPVLVGDLGEIERKRPGKVGDLSERLNAPSRPAKPIAAPPSASVLAGTVDLYYEMDNREAKLAPGQRVGVVLPVSGEVEKLVVPWSAVVIDIHGGTWVYEQVADRTYIRRRVRVERVEGKEAVLAAGPGTGAVVVKDGAQEMFGTEVGFSK